MSKHTLGPWKRERLVRGKYHGCEGIFPQDSCAPAFALLPPGREDIQEANASLIAAAPELLEACKNMLELMAHLPKADGAINIFNVDIYGERTEAAEKIRESVIRGLQAAIAKADAIE